MSNIAKLKKKAAEFELKKQPDKALAVYVDLLAEYDSSPEELDVALFNRVGDLLLRQGNVADALDYYEKAVDHYSEGGFFNNAIALCNKILRQSPGRTSIYYKLGKISAQKGFTAEAKRNFLEFADRMQKAGKLNDAFRALKEFADLCPDQDDIRLMLADQLQKAGKPGEAVEQLQVLYQRYTAENRPAEAEATAARIRSIDPNAEMRAGDTPIESKAQDLVFLDLNEAPRPVRPSAQYPAVPQSPDPAPASEPDSESEPSASEPANEEPVLEGSAVDDAVSPDEIETEALDGVTRHQGLVSDISVDDEMEPLDGLQPTALHEEPKAGEAGQSLLDLQPTSFAGLDELPTSEMSVESRSDSMEMEVERFEVLHETQEVVPDEVEPDSDALEAASSATVEADSAANADSDSEIEDAETEAQIRAEVEGVEAGQVADRGEDAPPDLANFDLPLVEDALEITARPTPSRGSPTDGLPLMDVGDDAVAAFPPPETSVGPEREDLTKDEDDATRGEDDALEAADQAVTSGDVGRASTMLAAHSVEMLQSVVDSNPSDWDAHRELGEAMFEAGNREAGLLEFETAMKGYETEGNLEASASMADELVRADPSSVKHHQKRVEYAFRSNDKRRLVDAYLELADALFRTNQPDKARVIYHRVLELAPENARAQGALNALSETPAFGVPGSPLGTPARARMSIPTPARGQFVNLGDLMRQEDRPKDTRMVVAEQEPSGDEEADFADMLRKFKQGVADNVDEQDFQSHYDLGIAYKEMGLLDEAISEFQKCLRGVDNRVRTYEAIGQCFMEKEQFQMAATLLGRAVHERGVGDDQLVGVLYLLGRASEALGKPAEALQYYQRVFVIDVQFRDVGERMNALEQAVR